MRSSKTPLSFDDDTNEILSHSLSLCCLSQKVFLIKRFFQTRGRRQHKENLSRSRGTLFRSLLFSKRAKKCFSTRENFRAFNDDDLLFFLGQKQPVWVEKDARNSRAFAFKSRKRSMRMNGVISFSLSLSLERERGGTLVKTLLASKRRKAVCCGRVYYVARRRKLSRWKEGVKTTRRRGKMRCENSFKTPTNNTESKKKKESKRKSKREYF